MREEQGNEGARGRGGDEDKNQEAISSGLTFILRWRNIIAPGFIFFALNPNFEKSI